MKNNEEVANVYLTQTNKTPRLRLTQFISIMDKKQNTRNG